MADNLNIRRPVDSSLISLREAWEVAYWTKELGATKANLEAAIRIVGHSAAKVRAYLRK